MVSMVLENQGERQVLKFLTRRFCCLFLRKTTSKIGRLYCSHHKTVCKILEGLCIMLQTKVLMCVFFMCGGTIISLLALTAWRLAHLLTLTLPTSSEVQPLIKPIE